MLLSDKEDVLNLLKDSLGQLLLSMKDREDEVIQLKMTKLVCFAISK